MEDDNLNILYLSKMRFILDCKYNEYLTIDDYR